MVIMALDHVRDYFNYSAFLFDPADPIQSNLPLFFTRFITHFCAPIFSFLAGVSAYLVGKRKTKKDLSAYLIKRGIWLICIELTIVSFGWLFDIHFATIVLQVIWSLGVSMLFLSLLIFLPKTYILFISLLIIGSHNLFDSIHLPGNLFWSIVHEQGIFQLSHSTTLLISYPIIPWIAVMSLGYYFGTFYDANIEATKRKKTFNRIGIIAICLFVVLRFTNIYGDAVEFKNYGDLSKSIISFLNPTKYPPSLLFLLLTIGVAFMLLANTEKLKGKIVDFFCTFGRVPFFYYIIHIYLVHIMAMMYAQLSGIGWSKMILPTWVSFAPGLKGYGLPLWVVYIIWVTIIISLYPICSRYDRYKQAHKSKWYLSYL